MGLIDRLIGRYRSESGDFFCDKNGIVQHFIPATSNVIKGKPLLVWKDFSDSAYQQDEKVIRTLIVPEGIKGFCSEFLRGWTVAEKLLFPDTLVEIGSSFESNRYNVFEGCSLPEVVIPSSVRHIGIYAFGGAHIKKLVMMGIPYWEYLRQFKCCIIDEVSIPENIYLHLKREGKTDEGILHSFLIFTEKHIDKISLH